MLFLPHSLQLEKCCFSNPWPIQGYLRVPTLVNLPADISRFLLILPCIKPRRIFLAAAPQRKGLFRLICAKGDLLKGSVRSSTCQLISNIFPALSRSQWLLLATLLVSVVKKSGMVFIDRSLVRGDSGLVFDGGHPHQGRSVGFYPAFKNG